MDVMQAIQALRPSVSLAILTGISEEEARAKWSDSVIISYAQGIARFDSPLPEGFTTPTQAQIDAAISRLDVPEVVTSAQMIRALDDMGLLATVQTAVNGAGGLTLALWQHAAQFHRADPLIAQIAQAIGKSEADVDVLFVLAATF